MGKKNLFVNSVWTFYPLVHCFPMFGPSLFLLSHSILFSFHPFLCTVWTFLGGLSALRDKAEQPYNLYNIIFQRRKRRREVKREREREILFFKTPVWRWERSPVLLQCPSVDQLFYISAHICSTLTLRLTPFRERQQEEINLAGSEKQGNGM